MNTAIVMGISIDSLLTHSIISTSFGKEVYRTVQKTPEDKQSLFKYLAELITQVSWRYGQVTAIGISASEYYSSEYLPAERDSSQDDHLPLAQLAIDLTNRFNCDCILVNHSKSAVMTEFQHSKTLTNETVLSATIGDSCGISFYNKMKNVHHSLCANWAHSTLPNFQWLVDGLTPICRCGNETCIEQFVSEQGIERQYHQVVLRDRTLSQIFDGVDEVDTHSTRIYRTFVDQLARSLIKPIQSLRPKQLILSGSASAYPSLRNDLKVALYRNNATSDLPVITQLPQDKFLFAYGASLIAIKNNNNHLRS